MDFERGPKAKILQVMSQRQKKNGEMYMLVRGLKRPNAQDRSLQRLGCKNRLTPDCREKQTAFQKEEKNCQHSGNKWMIMIIFLLKQFIMHSDEACQNSLTRKCWLENRLFIFSNYLSSSILCYPLVILTVSLYSFMRRINLKHFLSNSICFFNIP